MKKLENVVNSRVFRNSLLVFVILFITYLLCMNYKSTIRNSDQLFAQYYEAYEVDDGLYDYYSEEGSFKDVLDLFVACRYDEAFQRLVAMNQEGLDSNTVNFFYGQIYLAMDSYVHADTAFKSVIYDNNSRFTLDAHWYRGLSLLKNKDLRNAKSEFTLLAEVKSKYTIKAKDILTCLNKV